MQPDRLTDTVFAPRPRGYVLRGGVSERSGNERVQQLRLVSDRF
jgi:hypothetical protein